MEDNFEQLNLDNILGAENSKEEVEISEEELRRVKEKYQEKYIILKKRGIISSPREIAGLIDDWWYKGNFINAIEETRLKYALDLYRVNSIKGLEILTKKENVRGLLYSKEANFKCAINLYKVNSVEELEKLAEKDDVRGLIYSKGANFKYAIDIYNINSIEGFEWLAGKKKVVDFLHLEEANFKYAIDLYNINSIKKFERLAENDKIRQLLNFDQKTGLRHIINLYKIDSIEKLEKLAERDGIEELFHLPGISEANIKYAIHLYKINSIEALDKLAEKDEAVRSLKDIPEVTLKHMIKACGINSVEKFEELAARWEIRYFFQRVPEDISKYIIDLYRVNSVEELEEVAKDKNLRGALGCGYKLSELEKKAKNIEELIESGDFDEEIFSKEISIYLKFLPIYVKIKQGFLENMRKSSNGGFRARTFPRDILDYISSHLTISYLALKEPKGRVLEKIEEIKKNEKKESDIYSLCDRLIHNSLQLKDVIYSRRQIEKIDERSNMNYFRLAMDFDYIFDRLGIIGKNLEELKIDIDQRVGEFIDNYSENKEKYLSCLAALLGYAKKSKEDVNKLLKEENLWEFKTSHLPEDLKSILEKIKDLRMEFESNGIAENKKRGMDIYLSNLEEHLNVENFNSIEERIKKFREENKNQPERVIKRVEEQGLEVIQRVKKVIEIIKKGEGPEEKDLAFILTRKTIFEYLGIPLTYDSLKSFLWPQREENFHSGAVEILKEPEEYLMAIDINPSCMRAEGSQHDGAFSVTQGPIFIIGTREGDTQRIIGRAFLVPIKTEEGWCLELKNTYGAGNQYIEKFAQMANKVIGKEVVKKQLINGELPKTKNMLSKVYKFYLDGVGLIKFEQI